MWHDKRIWIFQVGIRFTIRWRDVSLSLELSAASDLKLISITQKLKDQNLKNGFFLRGPEAERDFEGNPQNIWVLKYCIFAAKLPYALGLYKLFLNTLSNFLPVNSFSSLFVKFRYPFPRVATYQLSISLFLLDVAYRH